MDNRSVSILKRIFAEEGKAIFSDSGRLIALANDYSGSSDDSFIQTLIKIDTLDLFSTLDQISSEKDREVRRHLLEDVFNSLAKANNENQSSARDTLNAFSQVCSWNVLLLEQADEPPLSDDSDNPPSNEQPSSPKPSPPQPVKKRPIIPILAAAVAACSVLGIYSHFHGVDNSISPASDTKAVEETTSDSTNEDDPAVVEQQKRASAAANAYLNKINEYRQFSISNSVSETANGYYSLLSYTPQYDQVEADNYIVWTSFGSQQMQNIYNENVLLCAMSVDLNHNDVPELITIEADSDQYDSCLAIVKYWGFDGTSICSLCDDMYIQGIPNETDNIWFDKLSILKCDSGDYLHLSGYIDGMERVDYDQYANVSGAKSFSKYVEFDWDDYGERFETGYEEYYVNDEESNYQEYRSAANSIPNGQETMLIKTWGDVEQDYDTWGYFSPNGSSDGWVVVLPINFYIDINAETQHTIDYLKSLTQ